MIEAYELMSNLIEQLLHLVFNILYVSSPLKRQDIKDYGHFFEVRLNSPLLKSSVFLFQELSIKSIWIEINVVALNPIWS